MIVTGSDGFRKANPASVGTSFSVLVDTSADEVKTIESVAVSCGGTATDFTLVYRTRGSNDFFICNAEPIAAHARILITDFNLPLQKGAQLRVKASNANQIDAIAVTIDPTSKSSASTPAGAVR